ncbi:MAG: hypothetical protein A2104_02230 [Candidatus Melainabacteria bacterium GWF2_32_7]|nr:MAG: hypothetical protein A2104_02230 [Candidatus Melainabacteria bacterium GWF2_32_7]
MLKGVGKFILVGIIAIALNFNVLDASAKTFYGQMKDNLSVRNDINSHYSFHRKLGTLVRFAPSEYQIIGLAGLTTVSFLSKEVVWDLIFRQGEFDMQDAAANFKGLKDGMNGRNALEENEFRQTVQNINALTKQLIVDTQEEILVQKVVIKELQEQYNNLKQLQDLRQKEQANSVVPVNHEVIIQQESINAKIIPIESHQNQSENN